VVLALTAAVCCGFAASPAAATTITPAATATTAAPASPLASPVPLATADAQLLGTSFDNWESP
jgi:hypothetical protein